MSKQSAVNQKWSSFRNNVDEVASREKQASQLDEAVERLGISREQAEAIRLIAKRSGDQIGRLVASLIEDLLILNLTGQHHGKPTVVTPPSGPKQASPPANKLLTAIEIAGRLDISKGQAYTLMQRGEIPSVRFGRITRVRSEDLEEFIRANRVSDT